MTGSVADGFVQLGVNLVKVKSLEEFKDGICTHSSLEHISEEVLQFAVFSLVQLGFDLEAFGAFDLAGNVLFEHDLVVRELDFDLVLHRSTFGRIRNRFGIDAQCVVQVNDAFDEHRQELFVLFADAVLQTLFFDAPQLLFTVICELGDGLQASFFIYGCDDVAREVEDAFEVPRRDVKDDAHPRRCPLRKPDVCNWRREVNVSHSLSTH